MAPSHSRQLLALTLPTIAVILSYLWFKRKRIGPQSDPGDNPKEEIRVEEKCLLQELEEAARDITPYGSPVGEKTFSRSLSGVETSPIDIIIPRELRSQKTSPIIISDEDLDLEIEKIKSMKNTVEPYHISKIVDTVDSPRKSPMKEIKIIKAEQATPKAGKKQNGLTKTKLDVNGKSNKSAPKPSQKKTAQKTIAKVEEKLDSLKLEASKETNKNQKSVTKKDEQEEIQRQSTERDSANHSPADVMLASPSLSSISDNHSEGSSDSGKGGSDVATPPSRTPAGDGLSNDVNLPTIYEFVIPQTLVGKLIGRYGSFVSEIKDKTRAHIIIKKHPSSNKMKVCAIEGTQLEIQKALRMIRDKFPAKRYPEVTLEQVSFVIPMPNVPLTPDHLYLKLIEGINNDTIISCMVSPGHLFLQQPTHPSYPGLHVLTSCMNVCYSNNSADTPNLPAPIQENTVCVAQSVGKWYRAMVLSVNNETDTSYVTFLDYGGYAFVENSNLKQIRGDFLLLPFQAAECILANIRPVGGEDASWSNEAYDLVVELTKGSITITQIAEYTEQGVPLVLMYILVGPQEVIYLNDELVNRGFAEYSSSPPTKPLAAHGGADGGAVATGITV